MSSEARTGEDDLETAALGAKQSANRPRSALALHRIKIGHLGLHESTVEPVAF